MNKEIVDYLLNMGIKASYKGFKYLHDALVIVMSTDQHVPMFKGIYEPLAKKYNDNKYNVERTIRFVLQKSLGASRISISEFLALTKLEIKGEK